MIELISRKFMAEIKELQLNEPDSLITATIVGSRSQHESYMDEAQTEYLFEHFRTLLLSESEFLEDDRIIREFVRRFPYQQTVAALEAEDFKTMNFWITRFAEDLRLNYIATGRYLLSNDMEEILEDQGHSFVEAEALGRDQESDLRLRIQNQENDIIDQYYSFEIGQYNLDREQTVMTGEQYMASQEPITESESVPVAQVDTQVQASTDVEERDRIETTMDESQLGPALVFETPDTKAMQVEQAQETENTKRTQQEETIYQMNKRAKEAEELRVQQINYLVRQQQQEEAQRAQARAKQSNPVTSFIRVATGVGLASAVGVGTSIPLLNVIGVI